MANLLKKSGCDLRSSTPLGFLLRFRGQWSVVGSIAVFDDKAVVQAGNFGGESGGFHGPQNFVEVLVGRRRFVLRILSTVAQNVVLVK